MTKPLALFDRNLTVNAQAQFGEVRFQVTDMESRPVDGLTFEDCIPLQEADSLKHPVSWRGGDLKEVLGKVIRLDVVALGQFWGQGPYTGGAPKGKFPLAISFTLADGKDVADRIPPQGSRGWLRGYLR